MTSYKPRVTLLLSAVVSIVLLGQPAVSAEAGARWKIIQPNALAWVPFADLPPGAEIAVLYGDYAKAEPYAVRLKFPAGYEVANHSHPTGESITVISGNLLMAFGEHGRPGRAGAMPLGSGSITILPAGAFHHLWADAETVIEIHSTGQRLWPELAELYPPAAAAAAASAQAFPELAKR
jgi:hypothetical protein